MLTLPAWLVGFALVLTAAYLLALAGEPSSVWLMRDVLGVLD